MKIIVAGSGKLANAILTADLTFEGCERIKWENSGQNIHTKSILVHAGSGRQLMECFEFCERTKSVFIELSTGLETEVMNPDFPLIICPNTSILVLKTLHMLKTSGHRFENYEISITESHQSTKTTEPGTAFAFAQALKYPTDKIVSVRDPGVQYNNMGIPEEYLDKHAYHKIALKDGKDKITIETKVLGHDSYARGVKQIIESVLKYNLENKRYTVLDLIDMNML
ncbi:MAG TPA: dihydrodipicolinate reductase C-terminal domain-containing protein [Prolixibacteraceae bacterium]|nr:dihydrodipicolinate reductase C-terminal domain-containing protein [Prolixibacteraceae bacterium]